MLKKLLKYDLLYMYRCLVIFYVLSIICALATRLFSSIDNIMFFVVLTKIFSGVTITMIINIIINNILRMWARFISNLYGDESYLTHTLPIEKNTHYMSKFLTAIITFLSSVVVILITLLIAYVDSFEQLRRVVEQFIYDGANVIDVIVLLIVLLLEIINIVQIGYTGIILGKRHNNRRLIWAFVYGGIAYFITTVISLIYVFIMALIDKDIMKLLFTAYSSGDTIVGVDDILKSLVYGCAILYAFVIIVGCVINRKLLSKGVNVD